MGNHRGSLRSRRGQALPLFLVAFVAVVAFAGLAIDGARLFAEQGRLQGAADAAALGAAHELRRGNRNYAQSLLPAATHDVGLQGISSTEAEVVVHHPPVTGAFANSERHVEVVVRSDLRTTFMGMFGMRRQPVRGRAVAGLVADAPPCLITLAADDPGAYVIQGDQAFDVGCDVQAGTARDPFATLAMPGCAGRSPGSSEPSADRSETIYWPGCHEDAIEIRTGKTRLMPGVHIFRRGLHVKGGEVTGESVNFLFPASSEQTGVALSSQARVSLKAANQGDLAGVLMFAESGGHWTDAVVARGADSELLGALYFPGRALLWAPNAPGSRSWTQAIAERLVILEAPDGREVQAPPAEASPSFSAVLVE